MTPKRFIRRKEVLHRTGLCATTLFVLEKRDEFPQHILLTPRCAVWNEAEVDAWIAARMAQPAKAAPVPQPVRKAQGEARS